MMEFVDCLRRCRCFFFWLLMLSWTTPTRAFWVGPQPRRFLPVSSFFLKDTKTFHEKGTLGVPMVQQEHATVPVENFLEQIDELLQQLLDHRNDTWTHVSQQIRQRTRERHETDFRSSQSQVLVMEEEESSVLSSTSPDKGLGLAFERITNTNGKVIAIRTTGDQPLFNQSSVNTIRQAAEKHWWEQRQIQSINSSTTSRFTYQRKGNYEAHIADLGPQVADIVNQALTNQIYPCIRQEFASLLQPCPDQQCLFVYDSLYIRYNATEACLLPEDSTIPRTRGAGQPLHRDLSIASVNIMMNHESEFEGGGTFFENQLCDVATDNNNNDCLPLKPAGVGHCLMHSSAERHAGANTRRGVRDVMVVFVTSILDNDSSNNSDVPLAIQNALLKQCMGETTTWWKHEPFLCSLCHNRMAVDAVRTDGEAFQYLGNALVACANAEPDQRQSIILYLACESYRQASVLTPCDGRLYNNWGLAATKVCNLSQSLGSKSGPTLQEQPGQMEAAKIESIYRQGLQMLELSFRGGCDVDKDRNALCLNYGLFVANQDRFEEASRILAPIAKESGKLDHPADDNVLRNARKLYQFCQRQLS